MRIILPSIDHKIKKDSKIVGWTALCTLFMAGFFAWGGFFSSDGGILSVG